MEGLYITIVFGYLVVAYMAGAKLLRSQVVIVNSLFILFTLLVKLGEHGAFTRAAFLHNFISPEYTPTHPDSLQIAASVTYLVGIIGVVASLIFMWLIRHPISK